MRVLAIILMVFVLQASSCNREEPVIIKNNEGVITSKPASWKTPISENNQYASGARNGIKYNNIAVIGSIENGKNGLTAIDVTNGEKLWTWQDNFPNYNLGISKFYSFNNYLIWDEGRNLYCVNLEIGKTVWKKRYGTDESPYFLQVNGLGEDFYINALTPYNSSVKPQSVHIYKTSVVDGPVLEDIVQITPGNFVTNNGITTYGWEIAAFKNTGDILIFTDTFDPITETTHSQTQLNLYNLTQQKWVYEKKPLSGIYSGSVAKPKLHNGIVYMAMSPFIVAVDLMSGEIIWKREFTNAGYGTSGFILVPEKNQIIFNAEANGTTLYALDLTTGSTVWSEPSSGTSSHLQYLNGVVYWVGGGDGWLHAVDVDTGKHLWKIVSPDEAINSNAWFARYCAVFPGEDGEKGKVVVTSGLHAFAYEAER